MSLKTTYKHTRTSAWVQTVWKKYTGFVSIISGNFNKSGQNNPDKWSFVATSANSLKDLSVKYCGVAYYLWLRLAKSEMLGACCKLLEGSGIDTLEPRALGVSKPKPTARYNKRIKVTDAHETPSPTSSAAPPMTEEYMKRGMLLDSAADYLVKLRNKHKVAPAAPPQGTSGEQEDIRKNAETLRGIASATAGTLTDEVTAAANKALLACIMALAPKPPFDLTLDDT
eukprot:219862-Prorocentrum_minimum.AAC.1